MQELAKLNDAILRPKSVLIIRVSGEKTDMSPVLRCEQQDIRVILY